MTDLQANIGRNVHDVQKELEAQGYTVHLVRTGPCATGSVPLAQPGEKRVVLSYDGGDEDKVTYVMEGVRHEDQWSQHGNMQYRGQ